MISFGVYVMLYLGVFHEYLSLVLRGRDRGDRYFLYAVLSCVCDGAGLQRPLPWSPFPRPKEGTGSRDLAGSQKGGFLVLLLWMLYLSGEGAAVKMGCRGQGRRQSPAYDPPGCVYMVLLGCL